MRLHDDGDGTRHITARHAPSLLFISSLLICLQLCERERRLAQYHADMLAQLPFR